MDQVQCHHGHRFEVVTPTDQRVVCPLCGSVTTPKAELHTPGPGPLDKTLVAPEPELVEPPFASEGTHVGGQTVIVETPSVQDLSVPVAPPPSPEIEPAKSQSSDSQPGSLSSTTGLTSGSLSGTGSKSYSGARTKTAMQTEIEVTEPPNLPGYKVVSELGRGGMGVVYRVFDEKLDRHVALKTLQRISPVGLQRFKQEFRALADVSHPNLAALYDLLSDGKTWCFTMEILDAVDFLEFVWSRFERLNRDKGKKLIGEVPKAGTRLSLAIIQRL